MGALFAAVIKEISWSVVRRKGMDRGEFSIVITFLPLSGRGGVKVFYILRYFIKDTDIDLQTGLYKRFLLKGHYI